MRLLFWPLTVSNNPIETTRKSLCFRSTDPIYLAMCFGFFSKSPTPICNKKHFLTANTLHPDGTESPCASVEASSVFAAPKPLLPPRGA